jgi:hypothetical protein
LVDAAETASLLGARHHQVMLDQEGFEKALPNIVRFLEEPVAASSVVPMYFVCQRARQDVKVALHRAGAGRIVRRLQTASGRALRRTLARFAQGHPIAGGVVGPNCRATKP